MRKYTFAVSVTAHLAAVVALFIAPLFATELLPTVRDATEWIPVRAVSMPDTAPPSRAPRTPSVATPVHASAIPPSIPLAAPEGVKPEPAGPPPDPGWSPGGVAVIGVSLGNNGGGDFVPAPPPPPPRRPVPVGGAVEPPRKIVHVAPVYPPLAIAVKREGRVILEAIISENGEVSSVKVLSSVPLLDQAAIDAVRQWRFTPPRLNGEPIPVIMSVTVFFRLN